MKTDTVEHATAETLNDYFALSHPDEVVAQRERLTQRLADGKTRLEDLLLVRSGRGIEATVALGGPNVIPLFPRTRPDIPDDIYQQFLAYLHQHTAKGALGASARYDSF